MFCPNCGKPVLKDAKFCIYCGNPLISLTPPDAAPVPEPEPEPAPAPEQGPAPASVSEPVSEIAPEPELATDPEPAPEPVVEVPASQSAPKPIFVAPFFLSVDLVAARLVLQLNYVQFYSDTSLLKLI